MIVLPKNPKRIKDEEYLAAAMAVVEARIQFWPLTLRAIHYPLVSAGFYENTRSKYGYLSTVLARAREEGRFPWEAMGDRSRRILWSDGYQGVDHFVRAETENFLTGYRRDLLQTQPVRPELWVEKDTLAPILHRVAEPYCVNVVVARGFSSTTYKKECFDRITGNARNGQVTAIRYWGDHDPSGLAMLPTIVDFLDRLGCPRSIVETKQCGLSLVQVQKYGLPPNFEGLKDGDPRTPKYRARFGEDSWELDAVEPADLMMDVEADLRSVLDLSSFAEQQAIELDDIAEIKRRRRKALAAIGGAA